MSLVRVSLTALLFAITLAPSVHTAALSRSQALKEVKDVTLQELNDSPAEYEGQRVRVRAVVIGPSTLSDVVLVDAIPSTVGIGANIEVSHMSGSMRSNIQRFREMRGELWRNRGGIRRREIRAVLVGRIRLERGGPRFRCGNETPQERAEYDRQAQERHAVVIADTIEEVGYYKVPGVDARR